MALEGFCFIQKIVFQGLPDTLFFVGGYEASNSPVSFFPLQGHLLNEKLLPGVAGICLQQSCRTTRLLDRRLLCAKHRNNTKRDADLPIGVKSHVSTPPKNNNSAFQPLRFFPLKTLCQKLYQKTHKTRKTTGRTLKNPLNVALFWWSCWRQER